MKSLNFVVLSDFDGTIMTRDLAAYALDSFVSGKWKDVEYSFVAGKITLKESIKRQYQMFTQSRQAILEKIEPVIEFRSDFEPFLDFCLNNNIQFEIVSAGLDFIIQHCILKLNLNHTIQQLPVYSVMTKDNTAKGTFDLIFPDDLFLPDSTDFKKDLVLKNKKKGKRIYYIGDGMSDFGAVLEADFIFAVKYSELSEFCDKKNLNFKEFVSFQEIKHHIRTSEFKHSSQD